MIRDRLGNIIDVAPRPSAKSMISQSTDLVGFKDVKGTGTDIEGYEFEDIVKADRFGLFTISDKDRLERIRTMRQFELFFVHTAKNDADRLAHKIAIEQGGAVSRTVTLGDVAKVVLTAEYHAGGLDFERKIEVKRVDTFCKGDEGFLIIETADGNTIIKRQLLESFEDIDLKEQSELFENARQNLNVYAQAKNVHLDSINPVSNYREGRNFYPNLSKPSEERTQFSRIASKANKKTVSEGVALVAVLFGHMFAALIGIGGIDSKLGPVPVPFAPIEAIVDWNNAPDHAAQGFEEPENATVVEVREDFQSPVALNTTYDTSGVPGAYAKNTDDHQGNWIHHIESENIARDNGLYVLEVGRSDIERGESFINNCDKVHANENSSDMQSFAGDSVHVFTDSQRLIDAGLRVSVGENPQTLSFCTDEDAGTHSGEHIYIWRNTNG